MEGFRFTLPYVPRIADINYGGHVSAAAVLLYFQDARLAYLAHLGPFSERHLDEGCTIILPEIRVRYRAEMFLGDALEIGVRIDELRGASFVMSYRIERGGALTAEGTTPVVALDVASRKARRLPEAFRAAAARFEGVPEEEV